MLLFQVSSCDLEVIPPIDGVTSKFTYTVQDPNCTANCIVNFTNTSEGATTYEWDFGDETTKSTVKDPEHTYAVSGTYTVILTAKRDTVARETATAVTVGVPSSEVKADFTFAAQNANCLSNCVVTFTNKSQNAVSYEWDFGDASAVSAAKDPQHTYTIPGTYNVKLKATKGMVSNDVTIAVQVGPPSTLTAFTHTVDASNMDAQRTRMDYASINNNQSKIIVACRVLGGMNVRNSAQIGMYYLSNKWHIFNQDKVAMKANEVFNVVVAEPTDPNAFVHETSVASLTEFDYISEMDHPSVNSKPNVRVFITPVWEDVNDFIEHPVGVVYFNNRWHIMTLNQTPLPVGLKFNVIVSGDNNASFTQTASAANVSSDQMKIDHAATNSKPNTKVLFSYYQGTSIFPILNPHVQGCWYDNGKWSIFNENGSPMSQNVRYHILAIQQ